MYDVENPSDDEGLKVAVFASALNTNVPAILVPAPFFTVNIVEPDRLCTGSLNVAAIDEVTGTPEAPLAGLVLVTEGGVVSDCATAVVKDHFLLSLKAFPARSFVPVKIVATYLVEEVKLS